MDNPLLFFLFLALSLGYPLDAANDDRAELTRRLVSLGDFSETVRMSTMMSRVDALLDQGVDINAYTGSYPNITTALQKAVSLGNIKMAKVLLSRGADPNFPKIDHLSPLALALKNDDRSMIKLLLDNGALADCPSRVLKLLDN